MLRLRKLHILIQYHSKSIPLYISFYFVLK